MLHGVPKKARSGMRGFSVSMTCFFQVKGAKVVLSEGPPKSRRWVWSTCNFCCSPPLKEEIKLNTVLSAEAKPTLSRKGIYFFCLVYDVPTEYLTQALCILTVFFLPSLFSGTALGLEFWQPVPKKSLKTFHICILRYIGILTKKLICV